jgi:hypothetical protein
MREPEIVIWLLQLKIIGEEIEEIQHRNCNDDDDDDENNVYIQRSKKTVVLIVDYFHSKLSFIASNKI